MYVFTYCMPKRVIITTCFNYYVFSQTNNKCSTTYVLLCGQTLVIMHADI